MSKTLYGALCLLVPLLWGVISARVFDAVQARRRAAAQRDNSSATEFRDDIVTYDI